MSMKSQLRIKRQLEAILDTTANNDPVSLIVQTRDPGEQTQAVLRSAYAGIRSRSLNVSPAECLPPNRDDLVAEFNSRANRGSSTERSLAAQMSLSSPNEIDPARYVEREAAIIWNDVKSIAGKLGIIEPLVFASASSFAANISKDVLAQNQVELLRFSGVFRNLLVPAPRKSESVRPYSQDRVLTAGAAWGIHASKAITAWGEFSEPNASAKGDGIVAAVLDTGIDATHPDLRGKVLDTADFIRSGGTTLNGHHADPIGHGTHVAGTIAGGSASGSHVGMAPNAMILSARVIDAEGGNMARLLAGFDWALRCGADVINMSLGCVTFEHAVDEQWEDMNPWELALARALRAGVPVVAAIGNNGHQTTCSPANHMLAFAVGAHAVDERCAAFSGGSSLAMRTSSLLESSDLPMIYNKPDLSAPGVDIKSCLPCIEGKPNWGILHGSSMAAPHVTGAIAQLLSATQIKSLPAPLRAPVIFDLLSGSCRDRGEIGLDQRFGYGCLDIRNAIAEARSRNY